MDNTIPTRLFWTALVTVLGSTIAIYASLQGMELAHVEGTFLPLSHDSFYHARRILDAVADPANYYQFDPTIHAPEGSWLVWPWAFDWMMAKLTRIGMWLTGITEPMAVLVYLPPTMLLINTALVALISRQLGLNVLLQLVAVSCFALLPLTQGLHGIAIVDHHFIEHTFVLLTLYLGLMFFSSRENALSAGLLGVALGAAPAFHNGLFILQIPILVTLFVLWVCEGIHVDARKSTVFAASLVIATLAFLIPSESFQRFEFSYFIHSWFHAYIAGSTALVTFIMARYPFSGTAAIKLFLLGVVLLLGILGQITHGLEFIKGNIPGLDVLTEVKSVLRILAEEGIYSLFGIYSGLIFLLPVIAAWHLWEIFSDRSAADTFFSVMIVLGALLLFQQQRFHYFGSYALYLPLLVIIQRRINSGSGNYRLLYVAVIIGTSAAYIPTINRILHHPLVNRSPEHQLTRNIFPYMERACKNSPGIILADHNDGHFISFHSKCSVIGNNMMLTQQHLEKIRQSNDLLSRSAVDIRENEPWIDYVYVKRKDNVLGTRTRKQIMEQNAGLGADLLLNRGAPPQGYTLLAETRFRPPGKEHLRPVPLARFFRIERGD